MKRYLITLNVVTNSKKITAIKDLRSATGMGLSAAKTFVETPLEPSKFTDSFGGELVVNAQQLANLMILSQRDGSENAVTQYGYEYSQMQPTFTLDKVREMLDNSLDVSTLMPLEQ